MPINVALRQLDQGNDISLECFQMAVENVLWLETRQLAYTTLKKFHMLLQATLTNGQQVLYGCLNVTGNQTGNGCGGANIRNANFSFQPAERIVNLTLWPGYNQSGVGNSRAGAIAFSTSLVWLLAQRHLAPTCG